MNPEAVYGYGVDWTGSGNYAKGLLTQMTLPSLRVVTTNYDAAGRVSKVTGSLGGVETSYAGRPGTDAPILYTPAGAVSDVYFGKLSGTSERWAVHEQRGYNSRLQVTSIAQVDPAWMEKRQRSSMASIQTATECLFRRLLPGRRRRSSWTIRTHEQFLMGTAMRRSA